MREIKFRVYDKKHNKMEYNPSFIYEDNMISSIYFKDNEDYAIEDAVVMQFTGLKDTKGKEIYEGDIVKVKGWWPIKKIFWVESYQCCYHLNPGLNHMYPDNDDEYEVIGNIYKNPELIK